MTDIDSGSVLEMRDESLADLLQEVNAKAQKPKLSLLLTFLGVGLGIVAIASIGVGGLPFLFCGLIGWLLGHWIDEQSRTAVVFYDLEAQLSSKYSVVVDAFDRLTCCERAWHVSASGAINDQTIRKRNAGASHLIERSEIRPQHTLPSVIKSNLDVPCLEVGKQKIFFMPDTVLVEDAGQFGAVAYADLQTEAWGSNFIEEGNVPTDAEIVGYTWKHPNKNGGPDRRFNDNYEIPICHYGAVGFKSISGLNEQVEFSNFDAVRPFVDAVNGMKETA